MMKEAVGQSANEAEEEEKANKAFIFFGEVYNFIRNLWWAYLEIFKLLFSTSSDVWLQRNHVGVYGYSLYIQFQQDKSRYSA